MITSSNIPLKFIRRHKRISYVYGGAFFLVAAVTIVLANVGPRSLANVLYITLNADLISIPVALLVSGLAINIAYSEFYARRWIDGGRRFWLIRLTGTIFAMSGLSGICYVVALLLNVKADVGSYMGTDAILLIMLILSWHVAWSRRRTTEMPPRG